MGSKPDYFLYTHNRASLSISTPHKSTQSLNLQTHKPTNSQTYKLTNLPTYQLKSLQPHSIFHSVLAKILVKKLANIHHFQPTTSSGLSVFKKKTCILHHLASLFWLPARIFSTPISPFLPLKPHYLTAILPFLAMFFMARKGFIYTIAVDIYAYRLAFSIILPCV